MAVADQSPNLVQLIYTSAAKIEWIFVMVDRRMFNDSLTNLMSGLGTYKDKTGYSQYGWLPLDDNQLTNAYRGDWIARKVVSIPAYDATRKWRAWQAEGDQIEELEHAEQRLGLRRKVRLAMTYGRLYGGGAIIMGFGDNNPMEPVDHEAPTKKDGLKYLHAVSRLTLIAGDLEPDIGSENFGLPQFYEVNTSTGSSVRIHHTRIVRFTGNEIPDGAPNLNTGWSDSVLQSVDDAIKQAGNSSGNIAALVQEAKIDVIKIPGLLDQINDPNYRAEVIERYRLANIGKSTLNMLLMDATEEWERITVNFAGLPDVLKLYMLIASGAADIPATRMLGQSAVGLNATGDGDTRNYYDRIQSDQEDQVTPAMTILDEALIWSTLGQRDPDIYYDWNSLWQMDEVQRADVRLKQAQAHQIDVGAALIPEEALRIGRQNQLIEDGVYPGLEAALKDLGADQIDKTAEEDVNEVDPNVVAQFEQQKGLPPNLADPDANSNVIQMRRVDAFDADGDDADFNFVGSDGNFSGYAVRWGKEYHDGFRVQRGAFANVIEATGGKVRLLYQHDIKLPIGMVVLSEDDVGLRVDGQLNMELALARETKTNIEKNILNGLSIGYETFAVAKNDPKLMTEIPVDEVSVVTFPSMAEATIDANDATPRTLYVRRDVINGADIFKWAKEQGLTAMLPQSELHVTLIYMKTPIDWMKMGVSYDDDKGQLTVPPGGPRCVEVLGPADDQVIVLEFLSSALCYRHEDMIRNGATHSYPEYRPHITIGPLAKGMDAMKLEPYRGKIVLGPEIFEEVK